MRNNILKYANLMDVSRHATLDSVHIICLSLTIYNISLILLNFFIANYKYINLYFRLYVYTFEHIISLKNLFIV